MQVVNLISPTLLALLGRNERVAPSVKIVTPLPDGLGEDPREALPRSAYMFGWGFPIANDPVHHKQFFGGSKKTLENVPTAPAPCTNVMADIYLPPPVASQWSSTALGPNDVPSHHPWALPSSHNSPDACCRKPHNHPRIHMNMNIT
jgi:hypothetical protein